MKISQKLISRINDSISKCPPDYIPKSIQTICSHYPEIGDIQYHPMDECVEIQIDLESIIDTEYEEPDEIAAVCVFFSLGKTLEACAGEYGKVYHVGTRPTITAFRHKDKILCKSSYLIYCHRSTMHR